MSRSDDDIAMGNDEREELFPVPGDDQDDEPGMSEQPVADAQPPQFVVVTAAIFGPFASRAEAERFAAFADAEIDPAVVRPLLPPLTELLNWRDMMLERGTDEHPF